MIDVTLPWPPTGNHYKKPRVWKTGSISYYLTDQAKAYHEEVWAALVGVTAFGGDERLAVKATLYPPDRRRFDLDNRMKVLLDSLAIAGVFEDDSQIDDLHVVRGEVRKPGTVRVQVRPA